MICQSCQTINPEQARVCLGCGERLPRVCAVCGATNPADARFCNQCGSPLPQQAPDAIPAGSAVAAPTHAEEMETALAADSPLTHESDEQRRVVTVLFADLTSSTAIAENMDPEDVRALLGTFFEMMTRAIHRHGGTVEKYIGDAVMAVFGLPVVHEDDPLRAVRAALDMQRALAAFNAERAADESAVTPRAPELQMRIGINTGDVAAAGSAAEGRDFLITGDPVNVAARLQQLADPGAILVGPRTYRGTRGAVRYRTLPPVALRGRGQPIRIWEALAMLEQDDAPTLRPRGTDGLWTPLVGRESELDLLHALFSRVVRERQPQLVTVLGAPGIGKTRLVREFLARLRAQAVSQPNRPATVVPRVLEGRCPPYGEGLTYWPLTEIVRAVTGIAPLAPPEQARARLRASLADLLRQARRPEDPESIAAYLGHTIGLDAGERPTERMTEAKPLLPTEATQLQEVTHRAWRTFFEALATHTPLIVFIEDIHWGDDVLLALLEDVAALAAGVPLLFLCTARPELLEKRPQWGSGARNFATIALEGLSPDETTRLVGELLPGADVPPSLRSGVLEKAEGNPFYIEEIVRMLVDRGLLVLAPEGKGWGVAPHWAGSIELSDLAIPDTVQGVLAARLDLLTAAERDVLQHASVIGRYFWTNALLRLAPHLRPEPLHGVLDALIAKALIRPSSAGRSSVAPTDEQVYTFNHTLTREVVYSTIIRARRAREHARVAEWLESLARGHEQEYAELLAQHYRQYYVQANLARSPTTPRRAATLAKVVGYLRLAGEVAAARQAMSKAEGYYTDALDLLSADASPNDLPHLVALHSQRANARWQALRADDAWDDYREALRLWASVGVVVPTNTTADVPTQDTDQALPAALPLDWYTQGLRLYRLLVLLPSRSASHFQQPPANEALLPLLTEGQRLGAAYKAHALGEYARLLTARSFFWWSWAERRGEVELLDALRSAREAVRITEEMGDARAASEALDALGNIQAITSDLRGYLMSQTRRLQLAQQIEDVDELVDMYVETSQACQMVGEYERAAEYAHTALDVATKTCTDVQHIMPLRSLVLTYVEWDRWEQALQKGAELLTYAARYDVSNSRHHQWALLELALAHLRTGNDENATNLTRQALAMPPHAPALYIEVSRARLALARGATGEARQLLLDALDARRGRHSYAMLLAELAELAASTGDTALYERFGAQALEIGWRSDARKPLAQATRARARAALAAARWDDALADAQTALARYQRLGTRWEEARTHSLLAAIYRQRADEGDAALAEAELHAALTLYQSQHAVLDIAQSQAALAGMTARRS